MKELIALKRIGRTAVGGTFRARAHEARALVAMNLAQYAPKRPVLTVPKGKYQRRDMVAAAPVAVYEAPEMTAKIGIPLGEA